MKIDNQLDLENTNGGGVMSVTSFAGNKIIFSFKTAVDDIKINVQHYSKFLKKTVSLNGTVYNQEYIHAR